MLGEFNIQQFVSAFVVLFADIDVTGSIPIFLSLKKKGKKIEPYMTAKVIYGSIRRFLYYFEHGNRISMFLMSARKISE